jgi:hypothetical protein
MEWSGTLGRQRRRSGTVLVAVCLLAAGLFAGPSQATEAQAKPRAFRAEQLTVQSRVEGAKAPSGRYAQSDPELLASTSSDVTTVAVKLDYDALSSYKGHINGLDATSPSVTGKKLDLRSKSADRYADHIQAKEAEFRDALAEVAPEAEISQSLQVVYGGVAMRVPANKAAAIAEIPGVLAVQKDVARPILTDSSTEFIGAPHVWDQLGGKDDAGEGIVVGILDSGGWPEHPSFADDGSLPAPPPKADGTARACEFGDNPLTPANDPFVCNNKLVGGQPFLDTALAVGEDPPLPTSARDLDGHGTHTASTSTGVEVEDVELLGVQRGPIRGVAPGAHLSVYRVCGLASCYATDSAAAVGQAILDGVKVINFSIGGGAQPYTDASELAFLDAYEAGVFVAASAGNSGPGPATTEHLSPWVTTVAASTQDRAFESTLTLTSGEDTIELKGASVTQGAGPAPVVRAEDVAGYDGGALCETPAADGLFAGKIVVCQRGVNARVEKGYNVLQGDAVAMILYNPVLQDIETDSHWLPTVHVAGPEGIVDFLDTHTDITGSFTAGEKVTGRGDIIAGFSSRGPAGNILKPEITAPGVQILAGDSPAASEIVNGPQGEYFQAIAGTSMSSPHIAGSGALLAALHPDWTPGQIKSAMMTTARTDLVKEDEETPADAFDFGAGHIDLTVADDPGITFSETVERMISLGNDPDTAIDMNLPSVYAPRLPGRISTTRTAVNTTDKAITYEVSTTSSAGSIKVTPKRFTVQPGASQTLAITIDGSALADGTTGFGQITLDQFRGSRLLHLPVAFTRSPGDVTLEQTCDRYTIGLMRLSAECTVTARNNALDPATVDLTSRTNDRINIRDAEGAEWVNYHKVTAQFDLSPRMPGVPSIAPGASPAGGSLLPLADFGITPEAVDDETLLNFDTPEFEFGGETWTSMGVTSDGYLVAGPASVEDVDFIPQDLPNPVRPNNVIAPFWTDTSGEDATGIYVGALTDNTTGESWIVVEWDLVLVGTTDRTHFQTWIGVNGTEDVSFTYDFANLTDPGEALGLTVGAENFVGTGGDQIDGFPTEEYVVTSTDSAPGGSQSYSMTLRGKRYGAGLLTTTMLTDAVRGETVLQTPIRVGLTGPG